MADSPPPKKTGNVNKKDKKSQPLADSPVRVLLEKRVRRIARTNDENGTANTIEILEPWDFSI